MNRLGGSSLLDCVVFGLAAARSSVEWVANLAVGESQALPNVVNVVEGGEEEVEVEVEVDEEGEEGEEGVVDLASRSRVQIGGTTYDITDFLDLHPGGKLLVKLGEDLTERFTQAHGDDLALLDRDEIQIVGAGRQGGNKEKGDKPKEHRLANYGGKGGGWREILGRHAWFFFHSIAAKCRLLAHPYLPFFPRPAPSRSPLTPRCRRCPRCRRAPSPSSSIQTPTTLPNRTSRQCATL